MQCPCWQWLSSLQAGAASPGKPPDWVATLKGEVQHHQGCNYFQIWSRITVVYNYETLLFSFHTNACSQNIML